MYNYYYLFVCLDANTISQMVSSTPPGAITASLSRFPQYKKWSK